MAELMHTKISVIIIAFLLGGAVQFRSGRKFPGPSSPSSTPFSPLPFLYPFLHGYPLSPPPFSTPPCTPPALPLMLPPPPSPPHSVCMTTHQLIHGNEEMGEVAYSFPAERNAIVIHDHVPHTLGSWPWFQYTPTRD